MAKGRDEQGAGKQECAAQAKVSSDVKGPDDTCKNDGCNEGLGAQADSDAESQKFRGHIYRGDKIGDKASGLCNITQIAVGIAREIDDPSLGPVDGDAQEHKDNDGHHRRDKRAPIAAGQEREGNDHAERRFERQ